MYDVYGLGNALVDMEFGIDDGYLTTHRIAKGHMTLVDEARIEALLAGLEELDATRMSGGSAANTLILIVCQRNRKNQQLQILSQCKKHRGHLFSESQRNPLPVHQFQEGVVHQFHRHFTQ